MYPLGRRKKKRNPAPEERPSGIVILEFFDERNGQDQFSLELSEEDFAHYEAMAERTGVPVEDLMVELAEEKMRERSTQWVIPQVDAFGRVSVEGGTPVDLSAVRNGRSE